MDNGQNKLAIAIIAFFMCISSITMAQNFKSETDSISYSVGVVFAKQMKQQGMTNLNADMVAKAMNDYMSGTMTLITEQECETIMRNHFNALQQKQEAQAKEVGTKFLAENAKKPGIMTTASGLQYEVLRKGDGNTSPALTDKVKVHYHGMLLDGKVFDSSVDRGEPISFPLNGVIQGWQEGVQLMVVGDKYKFYIPSDLAYGSRGAGAMIGPHSALIFEVELLGINE